MRRSILGLGIYYPTNSVKAALCIRGRQLLYARCQDYNIPHNKLGKLIVAGRGQRPYLEKIMSRINLLPSENRPPLELIHGSQAREMQPDLSPNIESALYSPETGIVDSHALMESFEKEIADFEAGSIVCSTRVVRVDPAKDSGLASGGWVVQTLTSQNDDTWESRTDALLAKVLIDASGLSANLILNSLLPRERAIPMYYARGSYVSYRGPGVSAVSKLIYPIPELTRNTVGSSDPSNFQSLGTHLTLDMSRNVRFGPDIEWLTPPRFSNDNGEFETKEEAIDFWKRYLRPDGLEQHIQGMHRAITTYLPNVTLSGLQPDYVGIRPKLVPPTGGFCDFQIRMDDSFSFGGSGNAPMITLLGIESPGLTASLAIAEAVTDRLEHNGITQ